MTAKEFMEKHKEDAKGNCPCIIDAQGNVYECPRGHLNALLELKNEKDLLAEIPDNISPLFYMILETGAVVVDYENQVYNEELTQEQRYTLLDLSEEGFIRIYLKDIHHNISL